jgi:hypothetical protein
MEPKTSLRNIQWFIQPDELHLGLASPIFVIEAKSLD